MMDVNRVTIQDCGRDMPINNNRVFIDGTEIFGISRCDVRLAAGELNVVTIEFVAFVGESV